MTQEERRIYLIKELLAEDPRYEEAKIPSNPLEQKSMLRALFNLRMPRIASQEFLDIQDSYLQEETRKKGITSIDDLTPIQDDLYLWQGDITTLKCGAIVNAANSQMLGCFYPNHGCIDNAIHTYAGIQLRAACNEVIQKQGHNEKTGSAKITPAFNLPCDYVIHTVGPIVQIRVTKQDESLLKSCYESCLKLADENHLDSIAFCCISTGEFHFPHKMAAKIAITTTKEYKQKTNSKVKVIFNEFKNEDYEIYRNLLQ